MDQITAFLNSDKLPSWFPLAGTNYVQGKTIVDFVNLDKPSLWLAVGMVFFNPIYWNLVARNEYNNKSLQKSFGSPTYGCYFLALTIFFLGIIRDFFYERALRDQPQLKELAHPVAKLVGAALFGAGQVLVVTSIYALGITGTYLGDYFGILMSERVTAFPFNILSDPMYVGSTMAFMGTAIWYESPVGVYISVLVWLVYSIALKFEGPFTDKIYSARDTKEAGIKKSTPSVPATPSRKSARVSSGGKVGSYAAAAAEPPAENGLPSVTPRPQRTAVLASAREGEDSPMRMTRSRSKARGLGSGDDEE